MANGDAAAAAGLSKFASTQDIRLGYDNDNIRGDELAAHLTAGTHPASAIVSGTFDAARIPNLDASKITTGNISRPVITSSACTLGASTVSSISSPAAAFAVTSGGAAYFSSSFANPYAFNNPVGGSTRSLWIASDGTIGYSASTKSVKQNIIDASLTADAAKKLQLREFRYKKDVKELGEEAPVHTGLIAEELLEIPGMEYFVFTDEKGKPQGVHYERLALALIPLIQDQEARISAIEERLK